MALFQKKTTEEKPNALAQIKQLKKQNLSNNQIIQNLQGQGYKPHEIFDGLNQIDAEPQATGQPMPEPAPIPQEPQPMAQQYQQPMPQQYQQPQQYPMPQQGLSIQREDIEEIVEEIIDEKWEELITAVEKIVAWKEDLESQISNTQKEIEDMKKEFSELRQGMIGQLSSHQQNMNDVGTELKAMQKVFKQSIPELADKISELSRVSNKLKKKSE